MPFDEFGNNPFFYGDKDVRQPMGINMMNHSKSEFPHDGKYYDRSKYSKYIYKDKKVGGIVVEGLESIPIESSTKLILSEEVG